MSGFIALYPTACYSDTIAIQNGKGLNFTEDAQPQCEQCNSSHHSLTAGCENGSFYAVWKAASMYVFYRYVRIVRKAAGSYWSHRDKQKCCFKKNPSFHT